MENHQSNNQEKLFEHPTLIGSSSSTTTTDQPTLYELDSNFSIMKVTGAGSDGSGNPSHVTTQKPTPEDVKDKENMDASNLINLNEMVPDPNDYIIEPNESNVSHQVDLEFKPDPSSTLDSEFVSNVDKQEKSNQQDQIKKDKDLVPKPMDNSFDVQDNITNICDEKFDLLEMSGSNISQASENLSEPIDLSLDPIDNKDDSIDKTPVKGDGHKTQELSSLVDNTINIPMEISSHGESINKNINDKSDTAIDLTLQKPDTEQHQISDKILDLGGDIAVEQTDQFADIASKGTNHMQEKQVESFIMEQVTSFTDMEPIPIPMTPVEPSQVIDQQKIKNDPAQSFLEDTTNAPALSPTENLKLETAETVEIPPDSTSDHVEPFSVEPFKMEKLNEKLDQPPPPPSPSSAIFDLSSEKTNMMQFKQQDQAIASLSEISQQMIQEVPNINIFSSPSSNLEQVQPLMDSNEEFITSSSSFQQQHSQVLDTDDTTSLTLPDASAATPIIAKQIEQQDDYDASTFSTKTSEHKEPLLPPTVDDQVQQQQKFGVDQVAISATTSVVEEAISAAKAAASSNLITDFLPTSASKILSSSVDSTTVDAVNIEDHYVDDVINETTNDKQKQQSSFQNDLLEQETERPVDFENYTTQEKEIVYTSEQQSSLLLSSSSLLSNQPHSEQYKIDSPSTITEITQESQPTAPIEESEPVNIQEDNKVMGRKNYHRQNSGDNSASANNLEPDCLHQFIEAMFGQSADILYWRDPKNTGAMFSVGLVILFSLTIFSVISVVAYTLLFTLLATLSFRVYKNVMQAVNKTEEGHPFKEYLEIDITPNQERAHEIADQLLSHFNCFITRMRSVLLVEDYVESFKYLFLFWALTFIGSWFNGMTLVILAYIIAFSLPKVYEMNQTKIDQYINLVISKINEVTEKIPFLKKVSAEKKDN